MSLIEKYNIVTSDEPALLSSERFCFSLERDITKPRLDPNNNEKSPNLYIYIFVDQVIDVGEISSKVCQTKIFLQVVHNLMVSISNIYELKQKKI